MSNAWIFPGQGSQAVGMGRDLYDRFAAARAIFDEADAVLGFSLTQLCFEGPADLLTATENAQPALLTMSVAVLAAMGWSEDEPTAATTRRSDPAFVAGHSLGEYSALVAARALTFATALRLVRRRGELMAAATEGTMAAVIGLDVERLEAACAEAREAGPVVIANENSPGQLVISGANAAVARAGDLAKAAGASRVLPLKVSAAFHSPLMVEAAEGLGLAIEAAEIRPAMIPVIANVSARPIREPDEIRAELVRQVTAPVRWIATIEYMAGAGVDSFVEIGAGTILNGLVRRIMPDLARASIGDAAGVEGFAARQVD
jgi:[acyl-carrier-protein] S-malonyltransferase